MSKKTLTEGDSRGVFYDLFPEAEAAELTARAKNKETWESFFNSDLEVTDDLERPEQGDQPPREEL